MRPDRIPYIFATLVAATMLGCDSAAPTLPEAPRASANLGNNFPRPGFDWKVNIIGVPKDKTVDMSNSNGRRIFVQLLSDNVVPPPGGGKVPGFGKGGGDDQNHIYLCNST